MDLDRKELKKLIKAKGVKSLDDINAFMRDISKNVVETILDGELNDHLGYEKHDQKTKTTDNARNGFTPKTLKSKYGEIELEVPRDRKSEFEPQIIKKRQKDILRTGRKNHFLIRQGNDHPGHPGSYQGLSIRKEDFGPEILFI